AVHPLVNCLLDQLGLAPAIRVTQVLQFHVVFGGSFFGPLADDVPEGVSRRRVGDNRDFDAVSSRHCTATGIAFRFRCPPASGRASRQPQCWNDGERDCEFAPNWLSHIRFPFRNPRRTPIVPWGGPP